MMRVARTTIFGVALILLLSAALGAFQLNADGIWFDEWWSLYVAGADVFNVSRAPEAIWARIAAEDIRQGVLYPYLLAGWGGLLGWTPLATRALSLFAGLIALASVYRLGWALSRRPSVGLGAAAPLGTSLWFIYYLHEMRVYMLLVMFTALLLLVYHRLMEWRRPPHLLDYIALALITGLLLNTHYFAGFVVAVVGVGHLARILFRRPDRRWWAVIAAWAASSVLLIPWIVNLPAAAELARNEPRVAPDAALLLQMFGDIFIAFSGGALALLALLLILSLRVRAARGIWLLLITLLPLNLAAYAVFGLNELRYSMTLLPPLALLAGFGVDELRKRRIPALIIIGVWLGVGILNANDFEMARRLQRWPSPPIREMAATLATRVTPDDVVIHLLGAEDRPTLMLHPLVYYMGDFGARIEVVENSTFPGTQRFAERVNEAIGEADRVWLINDPRWETTEWTLFEYLLNEQNLYHCTTPANTHAMRIWGFGRLDSAQPAWQFSETIRVSPLGAARLSGDTLQVWLGYQLMFNADTAPYSAAVHLLTADGQLAAQMDFGLPGAGSSCQAFELDVRNLPSGSYDLHLVVYNWQTGKRLIATSSSGEASDYPLLETVRIDTAS